jgi:hypothetical protein
LGQVGPSWAKVVFFVLFCAALSHFVLFCAALSHFGGNSLQSSHETFIDPLLYISMGYSNPAKRCCNRLKHPTQIRRKPQKVQKVARKVAKKIEQPTKKTKVGQTGTKEHKVGQTGTKEHKKNHFGPTLQVMDCRAKVPPRLHFSKTRRNRKPPSSRTSS